MAPLVHAPNALLRVGKINIRRRSGANIERFTAYPTPDNAELFDTSAN
jgi:hypothetical protein